MVQSYRNKNSRTVLGYTPSYRNIFNPSPVDPIKKALQQKAKGLEMVRLPRQNDFGTFCMSDETEKVYNKLEEILGIC
jgi:hypothetical protein